MMPGGPQGLRGSLNIYPQINTAKELLMTRREKAHGIIPTCGFNACARGKGLNAQQEKAAQSEAVVSQPKLADYHPR